MDVVFPPKLRRGAHLRVIAPARSRSLVLENDHSDIAESRLRWLGLTVSYGAHVDERDRYDSSSVESRLADLHDAFADPQVDGVLAVIGGFSSNELLPGVDYELIAANPKVLCGYSDITALQNAILAKAGLVTYSGPHWSSFGMRDLFDATCGWFSAAVMDSAPIQAWPSDASKRASKVGQRDLADLVAALPALRGKPVLGNVDFGHTNPQVTFPIGGQASLTVGANATLTITQH